MHEEPRPTDHSASRIAAAVAEAQREAGEPGTVPATGRDRRAPRRPALHATGYALYVMAALLVLAHVFVPLAVGPNWLVPALAILVLLGAARLLTRPRSHMGARGYGVVFAALGKLGYRLSTRFRDGWNLEPLLASDMVQAYPALQGYHSHAVVVRENGPPMAVGDVRSRIEDVEAPALWGLLGYCPLHAKPRSATLVFHRGLVESGWPQFKVNGSTWYRPESGWRRLDLEGPFAETFVVLTNDGAGAEALLTPDLRHRLVRLAGEAPGELSLSFTGEGLFALLNHVDFGAPVAVAAAFRFVLDLVDAAGLQPAPPTDLERWIGRRRWFAR